MSIGDILESRGATIGRDRGSFENLLQLRASHIDIPVDMSFHNKYLHLTGAGLGPQSPDASHLFLIKKRRKKTKVVASC